MYGKAVENAVVKEQLNGSVVPSGKYTTTDGKILTNGKTTIKVDYNGSKTVCEVVISSKGNIYLKNCNISGKNVKYTYGDIIYYNGEVIYFDVTTGKTCDNYKEENSNTGYNGIGGTENQNGCLKFYAFNDDGGNKLNLLLDHNTTAQVVWNDTDKDDTGLAISTKGPKEVLDKLKVDTDAWQGTEIPTTYSINLGEGKAQYQVDYSNYKARLITANEVAQITNNTTWDEATSIDWYYFDTKIDEESQTCKSGNTTGCKYGWLYDRTSTNCEDYGCLNNSDVSVSGYWTVSAYGLSTCNSIYISSLYTYSISANYSSYGVRPIIEVLKSKLN